MISIPYKFTDVQKTQSGILLLILLISTLSKGSVFEEMHFDSVFKNHDGTIVIYDKNNDRYIVHNIKRSKIRYTPCSTFKIPNSIIALELSIVSNVEDTVLWNRDKYPAEEWWPERWNEKHNMRTAMEFSVVPFYRDLASKIGIERMKRFVGLFNYGNMDISSGVDSFWLNGSIKISAVEQIEFLRKFHDNKLNISDKTLKSVKSILIKEENDKYRLSAKTGGTNGIDKNNPEKALGWYVGYVEKEDNVFFFSCNIDGKNFMDIKDSRIDITISVLEKMDIIDVK